ncbi:MAG: hypothetical protein DCE90_06615 [Pseudanabaena sp.]|nr:MAG: hypothetical protein DCE90_06615 [Pseudanabaena sp.]
MSYLNNTGYEAPANDLISNLNEVQARQIQLIRELSHELRTPLTLVYGYMQSIQRRSENLTDLQKSALEIAMFETKHTIHLLQEFLDLARLNCHAICLRPEPVLLHGLISEVIASSQQVNSSEIIFESQESNILALADIDRLKQVLLKLINSAVVYSVNTVTVRLEKLSDCIAVSICGCGCKADFQNQSSTFAPIYRVDRSLNHESDGVGLGLAIAKVLIEGMGGTLNVHSQLGEWSIFKIILKSLDSIA